ncbi:MAG: hypothetical protein RL030_1759 [Pseudomonadota bacterium]|jgi:hypothetical protein
MAAHPKNGNCQRILALLAEVGARGVTCHGVESALGIKPKNASANLYWLGHTGAAVGRVLPGAQWKTKTYFLRQFDPGASVNTIKPKPLHGIRLDPAAPAIVPPNVKRTVAPTPQDTRFTFTTPRGWCGQITRDWLDARLSDH